MDRRCIDSCCFYGICFGSPSAVYCTNRLTHKKGQKKLQEYNLTSLKELWILSKEKKGNI